MSRSLSTAMHPAPCVPLRCTRLPPGIAVILAGLLIIGSQAQAQPATAIPDISGAGKDP